MPNGVHSALASQGNGGGSLLDYFRVAGDTAGKIFGRAPSPAAAAANAGPNNRRAEATDYMPFVMIGGGLLLLVVVMMVALRR